MSGSPASESAKPVGQNRALNQSPIQNIPRPNLNFSGREGLFDELHRTLTFGQTTAVTQAAIHGLGGIGKTQLALEYCHRYMNEYEVLWWVRAEEPATLSAEYASLAEPLGLPEKDSTDQRIVVNAVRSWLDNNKNWLLIFDNVNNPEDMPLYLPSGTEGQIIITSRYSDWRGIANPLSLNVFDREESVDFLLSRTGYDDKEAADALAEELGDLPLALEQAAAYMGQTGRSLSGYLDLFRQQRQVLIALGKPATGYEHRVDTTWGLAFQEVEKASPVAADLLRLIAFLAPDDIPLGLLSDNAEKLPEPLSSAIKNPVYMDEVLAVLRQYSLVEVADETLSLHRLVQEVTRNRLEDDDREKWSESAVELVATAFPFEQDQPDTWPESSRLLPHALAVADYAETLGVGLEAEGYLLDDIGQYLRIRADYSEAKSVCERALAIGEGLFGQDRPIVAIRANNLGHVLWELGEVQGAKTHFERALTIDEDTYGPDHPAVAIRVNNLGGVLRTLGDLQGAKTNFQRALGIGKKTYGPNHPQVAIYANNLGLVLQDLGDLLKAREHFGSALSISEKTYGPDHPTVATRLTNLGSLLREQGDLQGARNHYQRALGIFQQFLGDDHPNTVIVRRNLAIVEVQINEEK